MDIFRAILLVAGVVCISYGAVKLYANLADPNGCFFVIGGLCLVYIGAVDPPDDGSDWWDRSTHGWRP